MGRRRNALAVTLRLALTFVSSAALAQYHVARLDSYQVGRAAGPANNLAGEFGTIVFKPGDQD